MEVKIPVWLVNGFETALGLVFIWIGLSAVFHLTTTPDPLEPLLAHWVLLLFNWGYVIAGVAIVVGLLLHRGDIEGFGLTALIPLLVGRAILFGFLLGWGIDAISSLIFSFTFAVACGGRIYVLTRV